MVRRLLEETDAKILLLEAGELLENEETVNNPLMWLNNIGTSHDYGYTYEPSKAPNNRRLIAPEEN